MLFEPIAVALGKFRQAAYSIADKRHAGEGVKLRKDVFHIDIAIAGHRSN